MKKILILMILALLVGQARTQTTSPYVILTTLTDTSDAWYEAVVTLKDYRNAELVFFNPLYPEGMLPLLQSLQPEYVAVIIKPLELDINFVRRFLMMSTQLDSDPFTDFSYGYITGATGADALNFVNRIIQAENTGIAQYPLKVGGCVASSLNFVYTSSGDYMDYLNPQSFSQIYMETSDSGSGPAFFHANAQQMTQNKLIDMGHNGDPHMIWLFEGGNSSPNPPVWDYDPSKIEDTTYARVGLSSYDMAGLNLYPAVAYNGACHSGEPKRVMVEGDIAATFGDPGWQTRFYTMSDTFSFALTMLRSGITGYFAPCGANNANDQGEEVYNSFWFHEPLGDIHKRAMDGVVMGFLGNPPKLKLYQDGEFSWGCDVLNSGTFNPDDYSGACYMLGGKANRIYFGDPLFDPFSTHQASELNICTAQVDSVSPGVLNVVLTFDKPDVYEAYFPVWDKFHHGNTRVYLPIELPADWVGEVVPQVTDSTGPYDQVIFALERFRGKTILHVEVDIPNDMYEAILFSLTFRLMNPALHLQSPIETLTGWQVFPNPSSEEIRFDPPPRFTGPFSLRITDLAGRLVWEQQYPNPLPVVLSREDFNQGLFFYDIGNQAMGYKKGTLLFQ